TIGHDPPPGAGPHPKPESVHPCPTTVVRLEGPFALGHGSNLLVRLAPRRLAHRPTTRAEVDVVAVGKLFASLANRRGPPRADSRGSLPYRRLSGDCSRVLTWLRPVKRRLIVIPNLLASQWSPTLSDAPKSIAQYCETVGPRTRNLLASASAVSVRSGPGQATH